MTFDNAAGYMSLLENNLESLPFRELLDLGRSYLDEVGETNITLRKDEIRSNLDHIISILDRKVCSGPDWEAHVKDFMFSTTRICDTRDKNLLHEIERLKSQLTLLTWWRRLKGNPKFSLTQKDITRLKRDIRRELGKTSKQISQKVFAKLHADSLRAKIAGKKEERLKKWLSGLAKHSPEFAAEFRFEFRDASTRWTENPQLIVQAKVNQLEEAIVRFKTAFENSGSQNCILPTESEKQEIFRTAERIFRQAPFVVRRIADVIALRSAKRRLVGLSSDFGIPSRLPFAIFPAGEQLLHDTVGRYTESGAFLSKEDIQRIEKIYVTFRPDRIAIGKRDSKGYDGYLIFIFDKERKVIAENPLYGNATYVISGTWDQIIETLLLSRTEVRKQAGAEFVIHNNSDQWLNDLQRKFYRD